MVEDVIPFVLGFLAEGTAEGAVKQIGKEIYESIKFKARSLTGREAERVLPLLNRAEANPSSTETIKELSSLLERFFLEDEKLKSSILSSLNRFQGKNIAIIDGKKNKLKQQGDSLNKTVIKGDENEVFQG